MLIGQDLGRVYEFAMLDLKPIPFRALSFLEQGEGGEMGRWQRLMREGEREVRTREEECRGAGRRCGDELSRTLKVTVMERGSP